MKMPERSRFILPFFSPPKGDIFGLPYMTLLGSCCESETDRQKRHEVVKKGVIAAFEAAKHHLGEEEARKLFNFVQRRPKRGRGKTLLTDRDTRLLAEYDAACKVGEKIPSLARRLRQTAGTGLGNTEEAIETQIRKLVKERKAKEYREAVEARRWRMANRKGPKMLLLSADEK